MKPEHSATLRRRGILNARTAGSVSRVMPWLRGWSIAGALLLVQAVAWAQAPTPQTPTPTPQTHAPQAPTPQTPTPQAPTPGAIAPTEPPSGTDATQPAPPPANEPATATVAPEPANAPQAPIATPVEPARAVANTQASGALRYTLENIELRGNSKTHSRVVLRYVPFRPGDVIDVDDARVELARYRLLGTGFFRDVQFSLRKGSRPGQVVLVIEVEERNTIVVNDVWMGLAADADTRGKQRPLTAYAGVDIAETNLAGTGITLGTAVGMARNQLALRLRFLDPAFLGGTWMTSGTLLYNDAQDYFGNARVFVFPNVLTGNNPDYAVLQYRRFGGSVGVGRDLSISTQLWANYRLERIEADVPSAASHIRGARGEIDREPIDFHVLPGRSILSTVSTTLQYDTRNKPFLPTRGWFVTATSEISLAPLGSEYSYTRVDIQTSKWWPLPHDHVFRLELFAGAIAGSAPFFERYYVGDFSDFRADRMLGLNVERRPVPNFFGTDIEQIRYGDYAAKINGEYRIPLYRGVRSVYGIDVFASAGIYGVAAARDLSDPPGGYSGAALVPIDLTANVGFRMDTSAGGFTLAFANVLGFIPVISEDH